MAEPQVGFAHRELRVRIPDRKIRVFSRRNRSFSVREARHARRTRAHPSRDVLDARAACARFGPYAREAERERGDAAPRLHETAPLERRNTWRVIGDDE